MAVDREDVENIAVLARLKFSEQEIGELTLQLNTILEYMDKLNELDTDNVEPLSHPLEKMDRLRDDIRSGSIDKESALLNAPDHDGDFFAVPKVIKTN